MPLVGCILILLSAFAPRLVIFLLWLFNTPYVAAPFPNWLIPLLGFFLMPFTTLSWAFAWNQSGGNVAGGWIVLIVVAVLLDLGVIGGGAKAARRKE